MGQYVSAPMHISKPWWDSGLLIVNAINSTAGLFSGDEIETSIEVKPGAQMLVTSASATRAHRMPSGNARVRQAILVANGGWLEMWPALFIPHAGSNYFQETAVDLEKGSRFLWSESFAPGRVASGEAWEFTRFESRFRVTYDARLIALESYSITPGSPSVRAIREQFPNACHAACYAVGTDFSRDLLGSISGLHHPGCWVGCTRLDGPAVAVRMVAQDNLRLSRALARVRELIYGAFGRAVPALRRA
jgi:urease accessory protein